MSYLIIYAIIGLCLLYVLKHQLDIVKIIPAKADIKLRNKIKQKQAQLTFYIKLCPLWPVLLIKEVYDEIKARRQS